MDTTAGECLCFYGFGYPYCECDLCFCHSSDVLTFYVEEWDEL